MTHHLFKLMLAALLLGGIVHAPAAQAEERSGSSARAGKVNLQVMVIYATTAHKKVDAKLSQVTRYLNHLKYTGYELLQSESMQIGLNGSESFTLANGQQAKVTVLSKDEKRVNVRMEITNGKSKVLDTTLSVNRDGSFIVAGPRFKDGILVLPVTAKY